jgi:hypothetical protein
VEGVPGLVVVLLDHERATPNELHGNRQLVIVRVRGRAILRRRTGARAVDSVEVPAGPVLDAVRGDTIGGLDLIRPVDVGSRRTDVARGCERD